MEILGELKQESLVETKHQQFYPILQGVHLFKLL